MSEKDGGAAFPQKDYPVIKGRRGMSLRDYFAAHAMGDVFPHFNWESHNIAASAARCYQIADALLKARTA